MDSKFVCGKCGEHFSLSDNRRRHEMACKEKFNGICSKCGYLFSNLHNLLRHEVVCALEPPKKKFKLEPKKRELLAQTPDKEGIFQYETGFEGRLKSFFIRSDNNFDLQLFLVSVKNKIIHCLENEIHAHNAVKFNLFVDCVLKNQLGEELEAAFKTKNKVALLETNLSEILDEAFQKLEKELEESQLKNSGWSLSAVDGIRLKVNKYNPLRGSTYLPLSPEIANKKACINVQNYDSNCFQYSVLAKFVKKHPERVSKYTNILDKYDFSGIKFPTPLQDVKKFERNNNISVNVFGVDKNQQVYPLKVCDQPLDDHRDLLLIHNKKGLQHYVYIRYFERLVHSQLTSDCRRLITCKRCFTHYYEHNRGEDRMTKHLELCNKNKPVRIELPTEKPFVEFENVERGLRVNFVVYADFESILHPIKESTKTAFSTPFQKHEAMSFCVYLKSTDDLAFTNLPTAPYVYRGKNAPAQFMKYIKCIAEEVSKIYNTKLRMLPLNEDEKSKFETATTCYMCGKPFNKNDRKVCDHCHITGKFRGASHNRCNLRYQVPTMIPVLIHNLSGYDSHFIIKELGYDKKQINIIPHTEEKYVSFSKQINKDISIRFLDTFRFMPASLDSLVKNLPELIEVKKFYNCQELTLLTRKGVFPYDYVSSWDKLEVTSLPSKEEFYNRLTGANISDEDYQHARKVWSTFNCKTLGDYSDHYLQLDTLLLADCFEHFRNITLKTHKLDPCHYYTLPGLSWDAMLRFTGVRLELLQEYDKILFIENGVRGGICNVIYRHCKANNKYLADYNPNLESTYISYQDCNNLYGFSMTKCLPYEEFAWIPPEELHLESTDDNGEYGYILEVDIAYPKKLHPQHNSLPFLSESMSVNKQRKLIANLNDKCKYIVHYITLKQALKHGLELLRIHRVLKFRQSNWLMNYIEYNASLRAKATNTFEKDLYKLYNNAVYGKTMENIRNRKNIKLVCDNKQLEKLIAKPYFIDRTLYNENLAAVHLAKTIVKFDKPIYIGMTILDLSKSVMYAYHYETMLPKYGMENLILTYMDTDSFIYYIKTNDLYEDMLSMLEYLDTSDYPVDHPCYSLKNKKVPGKFKDEVCGRVISEFVGLRAKMYSILIEGEEIMKAKGIQKSALKKHIRFSDYVDCIKRNKTMRTVVNCIQSKQHQLSTVAINKLSLSPFDDKRIIINNGIDTKAIGYRD